MVLPSDGAVRVPASWRLLYWNGADWQQVRNGSGFGIEKSKFNRLTFEPLITDKLRLEVQLERGNSAGIIEWRVEPGS